MPPEPKTPPHRRLIRTGTPGIYRRGDRFVAVTSHRGKQTKSTHDTKRDACAARVRRMAGPSPSRERFEDYAERWLVEYRGRTARGLAPSTRDAYAAVMRMAETWSSPSLVPCGRTDHRLSSRPDDARQRLRRRELCRPFQRGRTAPPHVAGGRQS
jgi:hypothetical protein